MKVAYQGVPGAFSHQAALAFAQGYEPVAHPTFAADLEAVEQDHAERGIVPVENSRAGPVPDVQALLATTRLRQLSRNPLPVRMHLLGLPGASVEDIHTAVSHPMALQQCAESLKRLGLAPEPAINTAVAAKTLVDPAKGVLASEWAAGAYGLQMLVRDMHDDPDNTTYFVLLARDEA
jgi:prephenate dehydratase